MNCTYSSILRRQTLSSRDSILGGGGNATFARVEYLELLERRVILE